MSAWGRFWSASAFLRLLTRQKSAKARLPWGTLAAGRSFLDKKRTKRTYQRVGRGSFMARSGDIFNGRVVTFLTAVWVLFNRKW
jgi:hypothetical protein